MAEPSGDLKRSVNFDMAKPEHRSLYQFSRTLNFSEFVRHALAQEIRRQQSQSTQATVRIGHS